MDFAVLFNDCVLPDVCYIQEFLANFPDDLIDVTVGHIEHLQQKGLDVRTIQYGIAPVADGLCKGYRGYIGYKDGKGVDLKPEQLDDVPGVRAFERDMMHHTDILGMLLTPRNKDFCNSYALTIGKDIITVDLLNEFGEMASLAVDVFSCPDSAEESGWLLQGEILDIIEGHYASLEAGETTVLIAGPKGNYLNEITATDRIAGEAIREIAPDLVAGWLQQVPDVLISRVDEDSLILHGLTDAILCAVSAGPILGVAQP